MPTLDFKGKQHIYAHHLTVPHRPLVPHKDKSIANPDRISAVNAAPAAPQPDESDLADGDVRINTPPHIAYSPVNTTPAPHTPDDNLIIHGDNLHALKALIPRYAGRVHCIYIDPPYNTGNEGWAYNDRVNSPLMREWLKANGPVDGEDLERHDKWLCMMWPRLHLLRELLADNGVIFISIDDNEQHHLRMLMDEIFGATNFVANVIWQKKYSPQNDAKHFSDNHDFVACYAKDKDLWRPILLPRTEKQNKRYRNLDNDPRGAWKTIGLDVKTYMPDYDYPITVPSGRVVNPPPGRCWRCSHSRYDELVADNRIWFGPDGNNVPSVKRFLSEVRQGVTPLTIWQYQEVGHTQSATQGLNQIGIGFSNPKPHTLIQQVLRIGADKDAIILDSFAGSGTTAHAVLALNNEDGGNRKFILIECEDYADSITAERVRRVINGVPNARDQALQNGLGGSFTYYTLGDPIGIEQMLTGDRLPAYPALAAYLLHTASGASAGDAELVSQNDDGLFYSDDSAAYHLLYEPDLARLCAPALMLNETRAKRVSAAARKQGKRAIVFGPGKYISQRELTRMGVTFCQLPYEMNRHGGG